MNIAAIQTFLAVHRLRNLNRAAEELNITQSAVTARLDTLEHSLGARLLNRSRKGATLTKAGYQFLDQAVLITRTWGAARTKLSFPQDITALFSFVCEPGLWDLAGQNLIDDWRRAYPHIAFEIWSALARDAQDWLASGLSDAALLSEALALPDIKTKTLTPIELVQVSTRARDVVRWDLDYLFVDYGIRFRSWHAETWSADETARVSFSNPEWALRHMLAEGGSAYLPLPLVKSDLANGHLHPVVGAPSFDHKLILSWRSQAETMFPWLADLSLEAV